MPDHPGYAPKEYYYRPQKTNLAKFNEHYARIDWSRKRETPLNPEFLVALCESDVERRASLGASLGKYPLKGSRTEKEIND